jgi:hypothetical protein
LQVYQHQEEPKLLMVCSHYIIKQIFDIHLLYLNLFIIYSNHTQTLLDFRLCRKYFNFFIQSIHRPGNYWRVNFSWARIPSRLTLIMNYDTIYCKQKNVRKMCPIPFLVRKEQI